MVNGTILAIIITFAINTILCPVVIPSLYKLRFRQQVRGDGPQTHLKKQGTLIMGGLIILGNVIITSIFYIRDYPKMIPVLLITVGPGIIGSLDDHIKIVMRRSEGLNPKQKILGQIIITRIFTYYLMNSLGMGTQVSVPFTEGFRGGYYLDLGIFFTPFVFAATLGADNGADFTGGLDGLYISVTILVATFLTVIAVGENNDISPITGAIVGSLLRFLLFNVYPAKVFMGDTGSLTLGDFVSANVFMMDIPLFMPLIGLVYLVEVLSVMIQVTYSKKTGKKRIFKMTPIHRHFELYGRSEARVVTVFSVITVILRLITYLGS